jgi:microcompartment protein CcmK/EutM
MNNQVTKIFEDMTDMELVLFVQEMKEDSPQGIIRENGITRQKCRMVYDIVGGGVNDYLLMVQISILQEAAYRFTPSIDELTIN